MISVALLPIPLVLNSISPPPTAMRVGQVGPQGKLRHCPQKNQEQAEAKAAKNKTKQKNPKHNAYVMNGWYIQWIFVDTFFFLQRKNLRLRPIISCNQRKQTLGAEKDPKLQLCSAEKTGLIH